MLPGGIRFLAKGLPLALAAVVSIDCARVSSGSPSEFLELQRQQRCINEAGSFDEILSCIPPNEEVPDVEDPVTLRQSQSSPTVGDVTYDCTTSENVVSRNSEEIIVFDPNADALYPGGIIAGGSIPSGHLTPIGLPRSPGNLVFTNISFNSMAPAQEVTNPNLATVTSKIQEMVGDVANTGAKIFYEIHTGESVEEISFRLGLNANAFADTVGVDVELTGSITNQKSYAVLNFAQTYYTVSFDPPHSPREFFADDLTVEDFRLYFEPGNPPAYVSSVNYGRMLVMTIESSYQEIELGAAITAYIDAVIGNIEAGISVEYTNILEESDISIFALGGSADDAVDLITTTNLSQSFDVSQYIVNGATFSLDNPGVPISYQLRWLANYEPARLSFTDDYQVRTCTPRDPTNLTEDWASADVSARPNKARTNFAMAKSGAFIYMLGGNNSSNPAINHMEYAALTTDGSLSPWRRPGYCSTDGTIYSQFLCEDQGGTFNTDSTPLPNGLTGPGAFSHTGTEIAGSVSTTTARLYLAGGQRQNGTVNRQVYVTCLDTFFGSPYRCDGGSNASLWTEAQTPDGENARLPQGLYNIEVVMTGNIVYVIGGRKENDSYSAAVYYSIVQPDGTLTPWTGTSTLPIARDSFGVTAYRNRLYIVGGRAGSGRLNQVLYATINSDGSLGPWQKGEAIQEPASSEDYLVSGGRIMAFNNRLFLFGGRVGDQGRPDGLFADIDPQSGATGPWYATKYDLGAGRFDHRLVQFRESLLIVGGRNQDRNVMPADNAFNLLTSKLRLSE